MRTFSFLAFAAALAGCNTCPSAAEIQALGSGAVLDLHECVIDEAVTIPAGVTIEHGVFDLPAGASVTLTPAAGGEPRTTLRGARVSGGAGAGASVRVLGEGAALVEGVTFAIERGIAVGVSGATVEILDATLSGNVDPERVAELPSNIDASVLATWGIAAIDGAVVTVEGSAMERFAAAGAVCWGATLTVEGTTVASNLGYGIQSFDCILELNRVTVRETLTAPGVVGVGVLAARGSVLTSAALTIESAPGYGVIANASAAMLERAIVTGLGQAGVWAENGANLSVSGGTFDANAGAAIAAVGASSLDVSATDVRATRMAPIPSPSGAGSERMADAIHVAQRAGTPCVVSLRDLDLVENERVGVVLDGASEPLSVSVVSTRVETTGTQLGAVAQNVDSLPANWDTEVTRVGSAQTLDSAAGPLAVSDGFGMERILMPPTIDF